VTLTPGPLPTVGESQEALRLGAERGRELAARASLRIRCVDCHGALLGTVTWVDGRPWAAMRARNDRLAELRGEERKLGRHHDCVWADRGPVLNARVDVTHHVLRTADVLAALPAPGRPRGDLRMFHAGPATRGYYCAPLGRAGDTLSGHG